MKDSGEKLERLIGDALSAQPLRRAPSTLESRVFAAIESRDAAAGWRRGFMHWPLLARATFMLVSIGVVKLTLLAADWTETTVDPDYWFAQAFSKFAWIKVVAYGVFAGVRSIPEYWLWGSFAIVAAVYATFFAISAVAYRTLSEAR